MKISIITPVKNAARYLAETIESVLNQRGDFEIEYFITDGDSTDGSLQIAKNFELELANGKRNIHCKKIELNIISEPDGSMFQALSKGLERVTGEVIAYINADDFYLPNAFACVCDIFTQYEKVKWVTGFPVRYSPKGEMTRMYVPFEYDIKLIAKGYYGKQLPFIQQESVFWRRELNGFIDFHKLATYRLAGDYFIWHSLAKNKIPLYVIESLLSGNRQRQGQLSEDLNAYFDEFDWIKDPTGVSDDVRSLYFKFIEKTAGQSLKRRLATHRIVFKNNRWLLR